MCNYFCLKNNIFVIFNLILLPLQVVWDVDETDEKQRKYVDDLFKKQFRQWKFDVQRAAECAQVDNAVVDSPADDPEEE